ncbi:conserved Plasmodium protein, unknown function [Plasmodium knowlesi strain H]|uniref:Uncharacterized protein n=3 Tax=Plasmodium knowlesi TaxID=5850 RepID=A0A5K1UV65_PLAKH|nr:heptatricopeptide repeat-containing protein, putative [Plasmodium knowlesi strain H]OTN66014.1 Uncharacterized protein PKNOH_S100039400 [Plasmodium knowlesi]CAA9987757.1 heptatricopeptide repeat-containing protein, putative [Plasmodium knowlesi strain H]SBO27081.1 conserved Plasmodium protein, unknown function [Plasmodium knowlesi strain H]SBO29440.1 conserved Plasmodium protein, unknown function [Plasmodium knowlesi strain H]VVS77231.1 heptatricopeptide repeat-containing protein, putative |eukprot:XP_002258754.1 hypothetical protein, conserved in Plasmodium species [Plasmodium knowlesi strain H]
MHTFNNILKKSANVKGGNSRFFIRPKFKAYHNASHRYKDEDATTYDREVKIKQMNSSVLCIFSNMLLKENIKNDFIWKKIERRSYEIMDKFEVGDIASFLFCLSKMRYETNLYESFIPIIKKKSEYFNTSNLAMLISTYSKRKKEDLIILLKEELKKKVHTIHNVVEICMILNALVKSKIYDEHLFVKLSNIISENVIRNHVNVRDICVIAYCYACILYKNMNFFKILAQKIVVLMDDINLVDLCRILYAYMRVDQNFYHILKLSALKLDNVMDNSNISDVINCVHFLPILKEVVEARNDATSKRIDPHIDRSLNYRIDYVHFLNYIINVFNEKLLSYLNLLSANQVSNLFYIYSRYNILISLSKMDIFISHIRKMKLTNELKIYILYSLAILLKNYESNNSGLYSCDLLDINKIFVKQNREHLVDQIHRKDNIKCLNKHDYDVMKNNLMCCLKQWEDDMNLFVNNYDICSIQDIIKVLSIFLILNHTPSSLISNIKTYVIMNYRNVNEHNAYTLMFYFQKLNVINDDEDFAQILKCKIKSLK